MQRNHKYGRPTISYMQNNPYSRSKVNCLTFKELSCRRRQWHPTPVLLPGKSHRQRSPVGCSPWGLEESDTTERLPFHFSLSCIGEGNGNPLQCSCLENPRDRGAWWAAVYGVAQSRTWLKRLSTSSMGIGGNGALAHVKRKEQVVRFIIFICLFPWGCFLVSCKQR